MDRKKELKKARAKDHESYVTLTILAILIPFAGLIAGVILITKDNPIDKKLGEHIIAISILVSVVFGALWAIFTAAGNTITVIYG